MHTVELINKIIMYIFFICYSYQFLYIVISFFRKKAVHQPEVFHRLAILIAARNEETVIGSLIDSIQACDYPMDQIDIYVGADNCTDQTAQVAKQHGAIVYERADTTHVGKGYVLNFLLDKIKHVRNEQYDAYIVLDADNILDPGFLRAINQTYTDGHEIVTCYRNSKNYGSNWISAGYALWFLREAKYLNAARMAIGSSSAVSGTGFLFSDEVINAYNGWNFFTLTEDIEFTITNVSRGVTIGYAADAILYDEQPTSFRQSWNQRLRWAKGYLQVLRKYGNSLFKGIFHGSFSCYDMLMNILPAAALTAVSILVNLGAVVYSFLGNGSFAALGTSLLQLFISLCLTVFILGLITTITEWKQIHCPTWKKLLYTITFPLFMLTYIPIYIVSLFSKVEWKPIKHEKNLTLDQIMANE